MTDARCPLCGGKGLEIVWGMLSEPLDDPEVVAGGCCVDGTTHQCAVCGHRWSSRTDPNPKNWPEDWPDVPLSWGPVPDNGGAVKTLAEIEVTANGHHFTVPMLGLMGPVGDTWYWYDGGRWHAVPHPPSKDDSLSVFSWEWRAHGGIARARTYDPISDGRLEYVSEFN